jgi:Leucine-rich repeat (LRR) protein
LLDLDLSGLKCLKSLVVRTPGLRVRINGLSSLANLCYLSSSTPGLSPYFDSIGHFTNLQFLLIFQCKGVKVLDLIQLKLLQVIQIGDFLDLITIRGLSSRMTNLRFLGVCGCKSLRECLGLDELYGLEELWITECEKLKELPFLGQLTKLRKLYIKENKSIKAVLGIDDLAALEKLELVKCSKLATLPSLVKLTNLQALYTWECPVQEAPGLDGLVGLVSLAASLGKLSREPPVLSNLLVLKVVIIQGWNGLIWNSIQNLLLLEEILLYDFKGEDVVPDLLSLKRLRVVKLWNGNLKDLSGLSNSMALERLQIHSCGELERLPEFERLTNLSGLGITSSNNLRDWPSASNLGSLKELLVDEFSLMKIVHDLDKLSSLRELELLGVGCENVLNMASLSHLKTLKLGFLNILEALDLSTFLQLTELQLRFCCYLERVTCSITLTALTELEVIDCERLVEMPDLSTFPHLEKLLLTNCSAVTRLTCNTRLTALREIRLIGCAPQIEMPDFSRFPKLIMFYVEEGSSSRKDNEDDDNGDDHEDEEDMADGSN